MDLYNDNERFISILSDYGFKVTFGNESNTRFLRRALQALIQSPVAIREVTFIQNEIKGITRDSRSGVYDLFCTDEQGNRFIVEMQLSEYPEFIQPVRRCGMKFYSFYQLNTLVRKGNYEFSDLPKIYCIGILTVSNSLSVLCFVLIIRINGCRQCHSGVIALSFSFQRDLIW